MTIILYLFIVILLTSIDQYSKFVVIQNMDPGEKIEVIKDFFSITHVRNYGAGFSILQNATVFLSAVSILAICILIYLLLHENGYIPVVEKQLMEQSKERTEQKPCT